MNYYQHNIGDYRRDTAHLSLLEHGIYRQLLDWYYLDESEIPKETQVVFRRLSARTQEEQSAIQIILKEFFLETETGWKHRRCDVEIASYQAKADVNRVNGKLGGRPKKTQPVSTGLADRNPSESENNPNHKPLTNNQEPLKEKPSTAFALPDWIDKSQWDLWLKTRKKKMIPEQMQAQVAKLSKWRDAGLDYAKSLSDAAVNGWQGLQEPQPKLAPKTSQSRHTGFDQTDYRAGVNPDGSF